MWMLRQITGATPQAGAAVAPVTYAEGGSFGAAADRELRQPPLFGPGVAYQPREDDKLLILRGEEGEVCAGVACESGDLAPGELRIGRAGGAEIRLCSDGSIRLNGLTITAAGELLPAKGGTA